MPLIEDAPRRGDARLWAWLAIAATLFLVFARQGVAPERLADDPPGAVCDAGSECALEAERAALFARGRDAIEVGNGPEAAIAFENAARLGSAQAAERLARLHAEGSLIPLDPVAAERWFAFAAAAGAVNHVYGYATFLLERGDAASMMEGVRQLSHAARAGMPEAAIDLASALADGRVGRRSPVEAYALTAAAARMAGSWLPYYAIGRAAERGFGLSDTARIDGEGRADLWFGGGWPMQD